MWWVPLAAAGISGVASAIGAADQQGAQQKMSQQQMDFQERMSSTSWQRGVADMRAAGINPMLSVSQGGASTPGGAQGIAQNVLGQGATSAIDSLRLSNEFKLNEAQLKQIGASTHLTKQDSRLRSAEADVQEVKKIGYNLLNSILKEWKPSLLEGGSRVGKGIKSLSDFLFSR